MTGMKEGAGEDPFADDEVVDDEPDVDVMDTESKPESQQNEAVDDTERTMQIPYKYRRDSVQEGRDRVPLFLQPKTKTAERDAMRELEGRFDDSVSLTDLREALVMVGLEHLDETESMLEDWGYGISFE